MDTNLATVTSEGLDLDRFRLRRFIQEFAGRRARRARREARHRRGRDGARWQCQGGVVPQSWPRGRGARGQCRGQPFAHRPRLRRRAAGIAARAAAPPQAAAPDRRAHARAGAGAAGGLDRRRDRPHQAARPSPSRQRWRALYLCLDRLFARPPHRLDQCRIPPPDAARARRDRRRRDRAERLQGDLRVRRRRRTRRCR